MSALPVGIEGDEVIKVVDLSLRTRLLVTLTGLMFGLWVVLTGYSAWRSFSLAEQHASEHLENQLARFASQLAVSLQERNFDAVISQIHGMAREPNMKVLALFDGHGSMLVDSVTRQWGQPNPDLARLFDAKRMERARSEVFPSTFPDSERTGMIGYYPLLVNDASEEEAARRYVLSAYYDLRSKRQRILADVGVGALFLAFLLALALPLLWYQFKRYLLMPLRQLTQAASQLGTDEGSLGVEVEGRGELASLAVTFRQMARRLEDSQRRLQRQRALYDSLAELNQIVIRARCGEQVLRTLCQVAIERAGFVLAWWGEVDDKHQRIVSRFCHGDHHDRIGYLENLVLPLDPCRPESRGPTAIARRERRVVIVNDFKFNPKVAPWRQKALDHGIMASAAFPVQCHDKVVAVFNVYSSETGFFTDDLIRLLTEMVDDVSFALQHFEQESLRNTAEQALRQSENRLAVTLDSIGDGVIATDPRGLIERMNPVAERLTGWPLEEARGLPLEQVFTLVDLKTQQPLLNPVSRILGNERTEGLTTESGLISRNGQLHPVTESAAPIRGPGDELLGVVVVFHDVSGQYALQQALKASEARYRRMFEKGKVAEMLLDPETGVIVDANEKACEFYGYNRSEMRGMPITDINILEETEIAEKRILALKEQQSHFNFRHRLKSGEIRDVEVYAGPIEVGGRRLLHSIIHDVTRRLRMERFIRLLTEDVADKFGEDFFNAVVRQLSDSLGVSLAMVGSLQEDGRTVESVALWLNGKRVHNVTYGLA